MPDPSRAEAMPCEPENTATASLPVAGLKLERGSDQRVWQVAGSTRIAALVRS